MKTFLVASLVALTMSGCAHNHDWIVPAAAGIAVGAAVVQSSRHHVPHQHYHAPRYYSPPPQQYPRPMFYQYHPYYPPRPVFYDHYCRCLR